MAEAVKESSVGLTWTGHPFIDAGVAGLTVFANKRDPTEVTAADLERFAEWAKGNYFTDQIKLTKGVSGWISVMFTPNFINPGSNYPANRKLEDLNAIMSSYRLTSATIEQPW